MITNAQRTELNRLLAKAIAHANAGNPNRAADYARDLSATLFGLIGVRP